MKEKDKEQLLEVRLALTFDTTERCQLTDVDVHQNFLMESDLTS